MVTALRLAGLITALLMVCSSSGRLPPSPGVGTHSPAGCDQSNRYTLRGIPLGTWGLRIPSNLNDTYHLDDSIDAHRRPVVFIGPFGHHSNELPWRESVADVVVLAQDRDGHIDSAFLEQELLKYADPLCYKDAIFLSPHKMIGGPSTPGVLVVRRELLDNRVPDVPGGGTVSYVNPSEHRYLDNLAQREEGGTPAIVESIRAGLVFQLKQSVGIDVIRSHEEHYLRRAVESWQQEPAIEILGNLAAERLSIVSFVVRAPSGRYLHHNFVVALLNDLFGIQSRGGCSCAGPYGHRLLGIDPERSLELDREIEHGCEGIKPGWARVSFNDFISETVFSYIVEAVRLVAKDGWRLLGDYRFEPATGM